MRLKRGFTLLEILIVIVVFSIGILAVLRLVLGNLVATDLIQTRTQATLLAKESMDLVFGLKDANRQRQQIWNCVFSGEECLGYFGSGDDYLLIGYSPHGFVDMQMVPTLDDHSHLYSFSGNVPYYSYDVRGKPTIFSRYLLFTGVVSDQGKLLSRDEIVKVESRVVWQKGASTGQVVLESFIGNY